MNTCLYIDRYIYIDSIHVFIFILVRNVDIFGHKSCTQLIYIYIYIYICILMFRLNTNV